MKKINVLELLKDCPKGMELDCTMLDDVVFEEVDVSKPKYPIVIRNIKANTTIYLTKYGQFVAGEGYKCVIFPKGKTTWKGFHRPFKDGDIVFVNDEYSDATFTYVAILKRIENNDSVFVHCFYNYDDDVFSTHEYLCDVYNTRFATEEEKEKLFDAIKENGYEWNEETKTLEKLDKSKFKSGNWYQCIEDFFGKGVTFNKNTVYYCAKEGYLQDEYGCHIAIFKDLYDSFKLWTIQDAKDGDVLANDHHILILKELVYDWSSNGTPYSVKAYCGIKPNGNFEIGKDNQCFCGTLHIHPATKEEKATLFQAIKENSYKWNPDNKALEKVIELKFKVGDKINSIGSNRYYIIKDIEFDRYVLNNDQFLKFTDEHNFELAPNKLVRPKFKVGDRIRHKNDKTIIKTIGYVYHNNYALYDGHLLLFTDQDMWELAPNKFDINTLKPFDKVLVRNHEKNEWQPNFFNKYCKEIKKFKLIGICTPACGNTEHFVDYCIPYEGNEHLSGKTDDCAEYFKTWK